jgi:hypothetical protein
MRFWINNRSIALWMPKQSGAGWVALFGLHKCVYAGMAVRSSIYGSVVAGSKLLLVFTVLVVARAVVVFVKPLSREDHTVLEVLALNFTPPGHRSAVFSCSCGSVITGLAQISVCE